MKKSNTLPIALGLIIVVLLGVIIVLALPFMRELLIAGATDGGAESPPRVEKAEEAKPAPPPAPKKPPKPKPRPKLPEKKPPEPGPPPEKEPEKPDADLEAKIAELFPLPDIQPLEVIVDNWENVPPHAFPKNVTINDTLEFKLVHEGQVIGGKNLPAGAHVIPLELAGTTLVVAPDIGTTMRAEVPVDETNFKDLIHARYVDFVQRQTQKVMERRTSEFARITQAKAHEEALADYNDGSDPRFDPMKESLRNAEAGTFELENTTEWRWLGKETVDGVEYEAGLAVFESESAFGVSRTEIKALMRGGKVEKWVDPASGEQI